LESETRARQWGGRIKKGKREKEKGIWVLKGENEKTRLPSSQVAIFLKKLPREKEGGAL